MAEAKDRCPGQSRNAANITDNEIRNIHACIDYPVARALPDYAVMVKAKKWPEDLTALRVRFLDGDPSVQAKVAQYARIWSDYANIQFDFGHNPKAEIRISFRHLGSWSTIGIDALDISDGKPTMNFGWFTAETEDDEYSRVVLHEFGHALGLIHEHQNPAGGINWNMPVVYRYYEGPPNYWTPEQVALNLFRTYAVDQTNSTETDPNSIMMYPIPPGLTTDGLVVGWNRELSEHDKQFVRLMYPKK